MFFIIFFAFAELGYLLFGSQVAYDNLNSTHCNYYQSHLFAGCRIQ